MSDAAFVRADATWLDRQRRRKTALEMIALIVPNAAAVFFSGRLVAQWGVTTAGLWAAFVALLSAGYWIWHRGRYPARVQSSTTGDGSSAPRREMAEDAGSIWHPVNLLVLALGAMAVATVVVVGLLVSFLLPLMIVVCLGVVAGGTDLEGLGWAALWTLAVALIVEVTVVLPLSKLWGLSMDDEGLDRDDFCPPPSS